MRLISQEKLYPHKVRGEGHFVALFEKTSGENGGVKEIKPTLPRASEKAYREFEKEFLNSSPFTRLHEVNGVLYALPQNVFDWKGLHVLRVGVKLGEVKNGRFEPAHALVMAVPFAQIKRTVCLAETDERLEKYLHGDTILCDKPNGWCAVCVGEYPVGLGKIVNGVVKNHLPKGLRKN
jgi:NOL1/NOP2/fmu family ribosome biogenesis protein